MEEIRKRVRKEELRSRILPAEEAALFFQDGMTVATSGNVLSGYPKAIFLALAERIRRGEAMKIDLLSAGPLGPEIEDALASVGGIRRRIGTVGSRLLREAVNRREVVFLEGKTGKVPQYARRGAYGSIAAAVVEAAAIEENGNIIPATCVYDAPDWVQLADSVFVEINLLRPPEIEGLHDIYLPESGRPIPIRHTSDRIGTPYIPLDPRKLRGIVFSRVPDRESPGRPEGETSRNIAHRIGEFLKGEKKNEELPPLEIGIGEIMNSLLRSLLQSEFYDLNFFLAAATDPVLDLIDHGRIAALSCTSLRFSSAALDRFFSRMEAYRRHIVIRPVSITNSPEVIGRLGVIGINSALEADILGQVNSSHIRGSLLVGGVAGSYDYARSGAVSVFALPAMSEKSGASNILPRVSHVDHTEHEVDILITEYGIADLRGLDPFARAERIIEKCCHPEFRDGLRSYVDRSKKKPGRIPAG